MNGPRGINYIERELIPERWNLSDAAFLATRRGDYTEVEQTFIDSLPSEDVFQRLADLRR